MKPKISKLQAYNIIFVSLSEFTLRSRGKQAELMQCWTETLGCPVDQIRGGTKKNGKTSITSVGDLFCSCCFILFEFCSYWPMMALFNLPS